MKLELKKEGMWVIVDHDKNIAAQGKTLESVIENFCHTYISQWMLDNPGFHSLEDAPEGGSPNHLSTSGNNMSDKNTQTT